MSCAVFTFLGLYTLVFRKSNTWVIISSVVAGICLFFWAAFMVWDEEHSGRIVAEQQLKDEEPKLMFEQVSDIDELNLESWNEPVFNLMNYGKRPARYVHIDPLTSVGGQYTLTFEDSKIIPAGSLNHFLSHEVDDGERKTVLYKRSLWDFLHNGQQSRGSQSST